MDATAAPSWSLGRSILASPLRLCHTRASDATGRRPDVVRRLNLEHLWDREKLCENPHKGWYLHYYDNGLGKYGDRLEPGDYLEDFPGLNHLYLRLAWSYLQPEEDRYNWDVIDRVIEPWTAHGYGIAFRVTCKETSAAQTFATPRWVMEAGAEGTFYPTRDGGRVWEPDYGDPIFLAKLAQFHAAFAERYADKPWLEYVDIGSYGEWGEGHTAFSSRRDWPLEVLKKHIDIYCDHYGDTVVLMNDDMYGSRKAQDRSREELLEYALARGVGLRDDGISVQYYAETFGESTLRSPELFSRVWRSKPVDMELEHYQRTLETGTFRGGRPLVAAVNESHATFVGFHGYPRQWLRDNLELTRHLANRAGYWFFPKTIELPEEAAPGEKVWLKMAWENHGTAPPYYPVHLMVRLQGRSGMYAKHVSDVDPGRWMPCEIVGERFALDLPKIIHPGRYDVSVRLYELVDKDVRPLTLGLVDDCAEEDGFYRLADLQVADR
jgi:hypothetical protein